MLEHLAEIDCVGHYGLGAVVWEMEARWKRSWGCAAASPRTGWTVLSRPSCCNSVLHETSILDIADRMEIVIREVSL
jgi:hypothetical protein